MSANNPQKPLAVITGAANGIGAALVAQAVLRGYGVLASDVDDAALQAAWGGRDDVVTHVTDVTDADQVAGLADTAFDMADQVALLFNNAGVMKTGFLWEFSLDDWRWMTDVNYWGVVHGIHHFVPRMIEAAKQHDAPAHIVNTCSIAGLTVTPNSGIYGATKQAVTAITEGLLYELRYYKAPIGVSALCPGPIRTRIAEWDRYGKADEGVHAAYGQDRLKNLLASDGMAPDALARFTFDAIGEDRFWILPHDHFKTALGMRVKSIMDETNPSFRSIVEREDAEKKKD